ncbi:hypothetical protein [Nocardiopsis tropica]|uniref:Uncharacterized protein n=1 Tax=Nocardiopsis tropica TaxID=109330 RepID=A0ABU7KQV6_9ACTN|nr:hypothetical protein [Nocardiopsis umidischolae]MEE2051662.1 hypothetical protein [Nocardiopsis umidischolae]
MTPKITPIETRYAGCRFRSRLEARWAVFFDHLDIRWEYEPQGFLVDNRPYLPDFLLPDCGTWVEVKGSGDELDVGLMQQAVHHLPHIKHQGECGPRLMVLGPIPEPPPEGDVGWAGLNPEDGGQPAWRYGFGSYHKNLRPWVLVSAGPMHAADSSAQEWIVPWIDPLDNGAPEVAEAYVMARSARFEHGEKG